MFARRAANLVKLSRSSAVSTRVIATRSMHSSRAAFGGAGENANDYGDDYYDSESFYSAMIVGLLNPMTTYALWKFFRTEKV